MKFLYFDLGRVLVDYSIEQMCAQMGAAAGIDAARVAEVVYGGPQLAYETGQLSTREFYATFCSRTGTRPDESTLFRAFREIFTLKVPMLPIVAQLAGMGCRLGILSNTCQAHWDYCFAAFALLRESFSVYALSFEIGACKPSPAIFAKAAELAGCRPDEIFYTDDMPGHVAGARAAGFDAVVFTSPAELAAELRQRGLRLDY